MEKAGPNREGVAIQIATDMLCVCYSRLGFFFAYATVAVCRPDAGLGPLMLLSPRTRACVLSLIRPTTIFFSCLLSSQSPVASLENRHLVVVK